MVRAPPRLPLPLAAQRNFRAPPVRGINWPSFWVAGKVGHQLGSFRLRKDTLGPFQKDFRFYHDPRSCSHRDQSGRSSASPYVHRPVGTRSVASENLGTLLTMVVFAAGGWMSRSA